LTIRRPVKLINTVPSAISEVLRAKAIPATVRTINLAGEALSNQLVQQLYEETEVRQIWNLYGPSEDTTYSTATPIERGVIEKPSIGRPIPQTQAYIVNRHYGLVPAGVTGELFLGGAGLARGYLDDPESTADRFVPHPFSSEVGARLYRTGDLARYLPNGKIDFLGRVDYQIKLRGHRIELGEIETALRDHPAIKDAVVVMRADTGDSRLTAYLVHSEAEPVTPAELRQYLQLRLPRYMVPQFFVWLAEFPRTVNGKLDRRALPDPLLTLSSNDQEAARNLTPLESVVTAVWAEVLGVERVEVSQNFFELGGHSLLGMQVTSRLKETLGIDLPLRALFEAPTVELLCRYLISNESVARQAEQRGSILGSLYPDRSGKSDERFLGDRDILPAYPIKPVARNGNLRMSIQQEAGFLSAEWSQFLVLSTALAARSKVFHKSAARILGFMARLNKRRRRKLGSGEKEALSPRINRNRARIQGFIRSFANRLIPNAEKLAGNKRRHIHIVLSWNGPLDVTALQAALNEIARRHESLRTTFSTHNGRPIQKFLPAMTVPLQVVALDGMADAEREAEEQKLLTEVVERSFDVGQGPLLRVALLKIGAEEHVLCIVIHHFVCDGVSIDIFNHEMRVLYESFRRGEPSSLPEPTLQFADFAHWQREWLQGEVRSRMISFWDNHLTGVGLVPELELPFAGPRPLVTSYRSATVASRLTDQLAKSLKALSYQQKSTMYMLCLTALKILLHHLTGKEYIGVMTPFANRVRPETRSMIGWIQHTMILNTRIQGNPTFSELLAQIREECLGAYHYQELPYSIIFSELLSRHGNHELLLKLPRIPYAFFDFETRRALPEVSNVSISRMRSPITSSAPGIAVRGLDYNGRITLQITYEVDVYKVADIKQLMEQLKLLLERIVGNPEERIETLTLGLGEH
jgi:non-ribosomal peptide synthetase component F/acyl carrier protein